MKTTDFEPLAQEMVQRIYKNLFSKRAEYADDADCLANFKQPTSLMGANPAEVCMWYDTKHFASMVKIAKDMNNGKMPSLETLQEKVGDYLTYGLLFYGLVIEMMAENQLNTAPSPVQGELFNREIANTNRANDATANIRADGDSEVPSAEAPSVLPSPDQFPLPKHRFWGKK